MASSHRPATNQAGSSQYLKQGSTKDNQSIGSPSNYSGSPARIYYINRDYSLSNNHSASTLQHSALAWVFSKSPRFPKIRSNTELHKPVDLPSTLDKKATSFGYGNKVELTARRLETVPGPDRYNIHSEFEKKAGRSFGLPYSAYAKTYVPGNNIISPEVAKDLPGPGAYYTPRTADAKKLRITLKPRGKMFNEAIRIESPPVNHYHPVTTLVESARFRNTTFGFGTKLDFTKSNTQNPGPGSYTLASCFDKFNGQKKKKNTKRSSS